MQSRGGAVYSVDIEPRATTACRSLVSYQVNLFTGDSVKFLKDILPFLLRDLPLDLLYLDSFDLLVSHPLPSALHHMNELMAAMPLLRPETLVVVDDSPALYDEVGGKGMLIAKHALRVGADMMFCSYQVGWTNMVPEAVSIPNYETSLLIERARAQVELVCYPRTLRNLWRFLHRKPLSSPRTAVRM